MFTSASLLLLKQSTLARRRSIIHKKRSLTKRRDYFQKLLAFYHKIQSSRHCKELSNCKRVPIDCIVSKNIKKSVQHDILDGLTLAYSKRQNKLTFSFTAVSDNTLPAMSKTSLILGFSATSIKL